MKSQWVRGIIMGSMAGLTAMQVGVATAATTVSPVPTAQVSANSAELTKKNGATFMETNKTNPGVVTLASGLQYQVLEAGTGPKPGKDAMVTVHYEGKLLDGQVFDSSYKRGQPASFPVTGVIPGWQEALQLMNTGATWMLYIPPQLAYGETGAGGLIGPNETLVFKVHLISIQ